MTTDPIALLRESHRNIERALAVLMRFSDLAIAEPLTAADRDSFEKALAVFRDSAPTHTADEEESVFPRLRREKASDLLPVLARIESLEEEHVCADRMQADIDRLCRSWLRGRELNRAEALRLTGSVKCLRDVYRRHIAVEEEEVFPAAASKFSDATLEAIAGEMALRRARSMGD